MKLLQTVQTIAPRAGWNAETNEKFIRQYDGSFYRYSSVLDAWFYSGEDGEINISEKEVKTWIDDLAASIGYIPVNSIVIPDEFVEVCHGWAGDTDCMLRAVSSTGNLTLGTSRHFDTEEKCYLHIWQCLGLDVARARMMAEKSNDETFETLVKFEAFCDKTCSELMISYQLEDWDDD